jgi:hypothetical protein
MLARDARAKVQNAPKVQNQGINPKLLRGSVTNASQLRE